MIDASTNSSQISRWVIYFITNISSQNIHSQLSSQLIHYCLSRILNYSFTSSQQLSDRYFTTYFPNTSSQQLSDRYFTTLIILCRGVNDRCFILFNKLWNISSTILQHIFNSSHYFWKWSSSTNWVTFFHHSLHTSYHNLIQQTLHHSSPKF